MDKKINIALAIVTILILATIFSFLDIIVTKNKLVEMNGCCGHEFDGADSSKVNTIANPASENCLNKGGNLEIKRNKIGEYGVCFFDDNRQCEEWALFRGQCPIGGRKVTGYQSDAEVYCAITGGQVENIGEVAMCKRIDGTYCNAQSNFDGDCPDPNDPSPNAGNVEVQ